MSKNMEQQVVYIQDSGCCGLRGRCQWVAGYNLVIGLFSIIAGAINLSNLDQLEKMNLNTTMELLGSLEGKSAATGGLQLTQSVLLITGGISLLIALNKRSANLLISWFVCIGIYVTLNIALIGLAIAMLVEISLEEDLDKLATGVVAGMAVGSGIIFLLIQVACIVTVAQYRKNVS